MTTVTEFDKTAVTDKVKERYKRVILDNPYVKLKPYPKQSIPFFEILDDNHNDEPHSILIGAGGYGGKTVAGSIMATMYLEHKDTNVLVTRKTYKQLKGPDSIWENLNGWLSDTCKINSSELSITAPNGAKIWFRAFNDESKMYDVKSESYTLIINDEASEQLIRTLKFLYRSLRADNSFKLPLAYINLSNPSIYEGSQYLTDEYVDGSYNHYELDWRDNPFVNKKKYKNTLSKLDFLDQQHQLYGDWHYQFTKGDLISSEEIDGSTIKQSIFNGLASILSLDLAGKGRDKTAISTISLNPTNNILSVDNISQTVSSNPERMIENHIEEDNNNGIYHSLVLIEQEPGSWISSEKYWKEYFKELQLPLKTFKPEISKFNRARGFVRDMRNGAFKLNTLLKTKYDKESNNKSYYDLTKNELLSLKPIMETSPNIIDTFSQAHHLLRKSKITS